MTKKSLLAAILLGCVTILFGAVVISGFKSHEEFIPATNASVAIGAPTPISSDVTSATQLSKSFTEVARVAKPSVVSITVTTKGDSKSEDNPHNMFPFFDFGPRDNSPTPSVGSGSGVIASSDGYIVTKIGRAHV